MNAKTTTMKQELNGVDLQGLTQLIETAGDQPVLAEAQWRASNEWLGGSHNRSSMQGFSALGREDESRTEPFLADADEPPVLLGQNLGANPVEYVLTALLGCLTTTLVYFGAAEGIELKSVRSRVEADMNIRGMFGLDPEVRNGFRDVRVSLEIEADAPRERIEALVQTARERSVVLDILTQPTPVSVDLAS
jgi:uncharacterized OsmC-like protein